MPVNYADIVLRGMQQRAQASAEYGRNLMRKRGNQERAIAEFGQSLAEIPSLVKKKREADEIKELDTAFSQAMIHTGDPEQAGQVMSQLRPTTQGAASELAKRMLSLETIKVHRMTAQRYADAAKADLEYRKTQAAREQAKEDAATQESAAFAGAAQDVPDQANWQGVPYTVPMRPPTPDEERRAYARSGHATREGMNAMGRPVVAEIGAQNRLDVAGLNNGTRMDVATLNEGGRNARYNTVGANVGAQQVGQNTRNTENVAGRAADTKTRTASAEKIAGWHKKAAETADETRRLALSVSQAISENRLNDSDAKLAVEESGKRVRGLEADVSEWIVKRGGEVTDDEIAPIKAKLQEATDEQERAEKALRERRIKSIETNGKPGSIQDVSEAELYRIATGGK